MKKVPEIAITGVILLTIILWAGISAGEYDRGKMLYNSKCQLCHGVKGDGKGSAAAYLGSKPADFTDPNFWKDHDDKKIAATIENGQDEMPAIELKPDELKALIDYLHNFKPSSK